MNLLFVETIVSLFYNVVSMFLEWIHFVVVLVVVVEVVVAVVVPLVRSRHKARPYKSARRTGSGIRDQDNRHTTRTASCEEISCPTDI